MVALVYPHGIFIVLILSQGLTMQLWLAQTLNGDLAGLDLTETSLPSTPPLPLPPTMLGLMACAPIPGNNIFIQRNT